MEEEIEEQEWWGAARPYINSDHFLTCMKDDAQMFLITEGLHSHLLQTEDIGGEATYQGWSSKRPPEMFWRGPGFLHCRELGLAGAARSSLPLGGEVLALDQ